MDTLFTTLQLRGSYSVFRFNVTTLQSYFHFLTNARVASENRQNLFCLRPSQFTILNHNHYRGVVTYVVETVS